MAIDVNLLKKPEILETISSAIEREIEVGGFMIRKSEAEIKIFENKFNMKSTDFVKKFEAGELDDREEFFEWVAAIKARERWHKKLRMLKSISK